MSNFYPSNNLYNNFIRKSLLLIFPAFYSKRCMIPHVSNNISSLIVRRLNFIIINPLYDNSIRDGFINITRLETHLVLIINSFKNKEHTQRLSYPTPISRATLTKRSRFRRASQNSHTHTAKYLLRRAHMNVHKIRLDDDNKLLS